MKKILLIFTLITLILTSACIASEAGYIRLTGQGASPANPLYMILIPNSANISANTTTSFTDGVLYADSGLITVLNPITGNVTDTESLQILINKTLTAPEINGAVTGTGLYLPSFTLNGNIALNGKSFEAGSSQMIVTTTASSSGLQINDIQDGATGAKLQFIHISTSPAVNDIVGFFSVVGRDSLGNSQAYGEEDWIITSPTSGSESSKIDWYLVDAGTWNKAMYLTGAGILYVDDSYDTFDEYDDAELLREGISKGDKEVLKDAGVIIDKVDKEGNIIEGEYMISLQRMVALIAGGVYQNRDYIESLEARIEKLEGGIK